VVASSSSAIPKTKYALIHQPVHEEDAQDPQDRFTMTQLHIHILPVGS
jgi:hypothetical protein